DETITITFDIGSSCAGSTTQTLTYLLHDPNTVNINLSCGANDVNYVSFDWDAAPGASGYDLVYQVNTNPSQNASTTNTTYQVNGLSPGDSVHIVVTPVGVVCGGSAEITCFPGVCPADAGTVSVLVNGTNVTSPTYEYYLCQGDQLDLVSLNDYTNPPAAGPDPAGLGYGFYTQAPAGGDPAIDAGFSGFIDYNANTSDQNTAGPSSPIYGTISASGSSFWIVPMTLDDKLDIAHGGADNGRGWDVNGDDCFDLGTPMKFTYLEDITASGVESCASSGQVEFTISGGAPQYVLGTNYSITNNGSGTLSSTTVANHNGTVTLTGLSNGDNYSITITDSKGCTYTTVSGTFGACTCGASISGNATICEGDNTDLSVTLNGSGPWNVSVSDGSSSQNLVASSSPLLVNVNPTSTTTYTVSAMSDNGCSATASIAVNVFPLPAVSILADKTQECGSLTTVFASQNDANVVSWSWNFGDAGSGTANTSTQAGPTHSFDNSGSYSVSLTVIDANQCTQAITEQDFVTVHPFPNADFVADPETGIAGTNFHFVSSNTIAPANYTWIFGDGGSEGPVFDFYSDHVYEVDGDYIVSLQVSTPYGCLDTASVTVHVSSLKIPNVFTPNQDGYNDRFVIENADLSDGVTLLIYNRWGKKVYENSGYDNSWDGDNCSSGTYFYVVTVGTQSFNGPLTIIRD
ncbi:MAG: gliding motility-associated C-terminal domain-containing protein, partial [Bacteroidetes bacterium]|nr:gliding motility-associated C-terminal domain-containing protein [Bacteroidota bacterium]